MVVKPGVDSRILSIPADNEIARLVDGHRWNRRPARLHLVDLDLRTDRVSAAVVLLGKDISTLIPAGPDHDRIPGRIHRHGGRDHVGGGRVDKCLGG